MLRRLPERFLLLDRKRLELLQNYWTVGKERQFDQVKDLALKPGITEIGCDQESIFAPRRWKYCPDCWRFGLCGALRRQEELLATWLNHQALQSLSSLAVGWERTKIRRWLVPTDLVTTLTCRSNRLGPRIR